MVYWDMFHDQDPTEQAHRQLMQALQRKDAAAMETIAAACPQAVQPHALWSRSPFQELAQSIFHWDCKPEHLDCLDVLMRHGASPMQAHKYTPSAFETLLQRGAVKVFERMHEAGYLAGWMADAYPGLAFHKLFTSTTWQHYSGNYPIEGLTRVFLQGGAGLRSIEGKPVVHHLLWTAMPQYGFPRPSGMEAACQLMLDADPTAQIGPTQLLQAWRANYRSVAPTLVQRYMAQGGSIAALHSEPSVARMRPDEAAQFQGWCLETLTNATPTEPRTERRLRF